MTENALSLGGTPSAPAWLAAVAGSLTEALPVAKMLASSGLVPKAYEGKPEAILIAGAMGARLGLDLFSSLSGIAVINGRPTLWGDAMLAVCMARPDWRGMSVTWSDDQTACRVLVRRILPGNSVNETIGEFSEQEAKSAGLWGKQGPWQQYPRRMIELRARSFSLRSAFADALNGFACREDLEDVVDVTDTAHVHPAKPEEARTAGNLESKPTETKPATETTKKADDKPAPQLHPALTAGNALYESLNKHQKGLGAKIIGRLASLNGAKAPKDILPEYLEQFGKDVAAIAAMGTDLDKIDNTIAEWEKAQQEGK